MPVTVTVVGAGGIGSHLVGALVPAVHRGDLVERLGGIVLRIHDSDLVSEQNLAHQRFLPSEVGRHKTTALRSSLLQYCLERFPLWLQDLQVDPAACKQVSSRHARPTGPKAYRSLIYGHVRYKWGEEDWMEW